MLRRLIQRFTSVIRVIHKRVACIKKRFGRYMGWQRAGDVMPAINERVVIWRSRSRRYCVSTRIRMDKKDYWMNEYNNTHWVDPDDLWMSFESAPHGLQ